MRRDDERDIGDSIQKRFFLTQASSTLLLLLVLYFYISYILSFLHNSMLIKLA